MHFLIILCTRGLVISIVWGREDLSFRSPAWTDTCALTSHSAQLGLRAKLGPLLVSVQPLRPLGASARGKETWLCVTQWVQLLGNKRRFRVLGRIPMVLSMGIPTLCLGGNGFRRTVASIEQLASSPFLSHSCKLGIENSFPSGIRMESVQLSGFCLTCQPTLQRQRHSFCDAVLQGRVGLVTTWLILPVVICLSQRLSHACLSISFYTAKLRMAH